MDAHKFAEFFLKKSLDQRRLRIKLFLNSAANRDLVDVLRVRYWYEGVKEKTRCTTAYQLEKLFEPLKASSIDSRTPFRNKWIRYETSKHTPRANLVNFVEEQVRGTSKELNHPLWEILRLTDASSTVPVDALLKKLDPHVQTVLFRKQNEVMGEMERRLPISFAVGLRVVKQGNLDALAALLVLWLEACQHDCFEDMRLLARLIYQLLLMLGMGFEKRNLAEAFFLLFRTKVFERTDWEGTRFAVDEIHYVRSVHLLYAALYAIDEVDPFSSWLSQCEMMQEMLNGKKGLDMQFGLGLLLLPSSLVGPPAMERWERWRSDYLHWLWGWTHLNTGTVGRVLDDDLWQKLEYELGGTLFWPIS